VGLDVELRDIGEQEADDRIHQRARVERAHQPLAVFAGRDIRHNQ
jgi:hypothetical protein